MPTSQESSASLTASAISVLSCLSTQYFSLSTENMWIVQYNQGHSMYRRRGLNFSHTKPTAVLKSPLWNFLCSGIFYLLRVLSAQEISLTIFPSPSHSAVDRGPHFNGGFCKTTWPSGIFLYLFIPSTHTLWDSNKIGLLICSLKCAWELGDWIVKINSAGLCEVWTPLRPPGRILSSQWPKY